MKQKPGLIELGEGGMFFLIGIGIAVLLAIFSGCKPRHVDPAPCVQQFDPAEGLPILPLCP